MRKALSLLAVGCLYLILFALPTSAADDELRHYDTRFWIKASTEQRYTDRVSLTSYQGQCRWQSEWMPDPVFNTCITYTQWGSINQNGMSLTASNHKPLELADGQQLLTSPDSRRLYISQSDGNGFIKVGYLENPSEDIVFDTETSRYKLKDAVVFQFLPTLYKNVAFANNSYYIVGQASDGTLVRTALTDFSTKKFVGKSPAFNIADTRHWAISTHGTLVVGSNANNEVIAYELGYCDDRSNAADECTTKQIGHSQEMIVESADIYINDEASHINLYSRLFGRVMSRVSYSFDAESLNRHVTYVALGDSFSSGEGAWNYDNKTDGDNGFSQEKCHQSYSAYPQRYASKHKHWEDEYYEPNLDGDMVINDFKNATCSGASTGNIESFTDNYKRANDDARAEYNGHFDQFIGYDDLKKIIKSDAIIEAIPGRALQIDFLREYKPAIATIGIGGNDIGFADTLKVCIVHPGTCSAASANKSYQGKKIQDEFWKLSALFNELHIASPNTRLYAVGYPQIIADNDIYCGANVLLNAKEREFVKQGTRYLNDVIKAAAKKNGLTYISFEDAIGSEGLCGGGTWGVNGLSLGNDKGFDIFGQPVYFIANESYHPSYLGQEMMAERLIENYGALDIYPNPNCPQVKSGYCRDDSINKAPAIPKYFGEWFPSATVLYKSGVEATQKWLPLSLSQFKPGAIIKLKAFSQETDLGEYRADANGSLQKSVLLPDYLEPGYHTLYASGIDTDGNELVYEQIFLYLPEDTKLGPCSFLPYSNLDQDEDGVDDACDSEISVENQLTFADPSEYLTYPNPERERPIITQPQTPTQPVASIAPIVSSSTVATKPQSVLGSQSNGGDIFEQAAAPILQTANLTPLSTDSKPSTNVQTASSQNPYTLYLSALVVFTAGGLLAWMHFGKKL